jgi:hypothetical protein
VSPARAANPAELLRLLRREAGLDAAALEPTAVGESGSAYWITDRGGEVGLLKLLPGPVPAGLSYLRALAGTVDRLRRRGYPAPLIRTVGQVAGLVFWIQERADGRTLIAAGRPDAARMAAALPELLRLNDAQAGLGTSQDDCGPPTVWPELIRRTLTEGGDGYCRPETLAAQPGTRDLLEVLRRVADTCCDAVPAADDFVHYDFSPSNLLASGTAITAVIDINPPVLAGDRAFDLATLLFYCYDQDALRDRLRGRLIELAGRRAARAYLAHILLRQADWSLRFYPAAELTRHFLRLARLVAADIDGQAGQS